MDNWQYVVGVQLNGWYQRYTFRRALKALGRSELSIEGREVIKSHLFPEVWLNEKGAEGWELVAAVHRGYYTEFFMKRRAREEEG